MIETSGTPEDDFEANADPFSVKDRSNRDPVPALGLDRSSKEPDGRSMGFVP